MRHGEAYRKHAIYLAPTRPTAIAIGERRCPDPRGQPGYLRVDTVHQGDQDGRKGVYHINAVDTVTQWEVVECTAKISERYLIPVLAAILHQFPFRILGFHADNGSEYINGDVARLLQKLRAEFTKSRAYRTQDNALVEGKRHGICPEDHASQERAATKMPRPAGSVAATAVKGSRSPKRAEEMAGPSAPAIRFSRKNLTQKTKESLTMGGGKVEIQRQDSHFPTAPTACGSKEENPSLKIGGVLSQKKYFVSQFRIILRLETARCGGRRRERRSRREFPTHGGRRLARWCREDALRRPVPGAPCASPGRSVRWQGERNPGRRRGRPNRWPRSNRQVPRGPAMRRPDGPPWSRRGNRRRRAGGCRRLSGSGPAVGGCRSLSRDSPA